MRILSIIKRIILQFKMDKRSLALLFIAPLFVLTLLWVVLDMKAYEPVIAITDAPDAVQNILEEEDANIKVMGDQEARAALQNNTIDAHLSWGKKHPELTMEGSDPTASKAVQQLFSQVSRQLNPRALDMDIHFLHGSSDLQLFDNIGPVLIGFFVFFFVFLLSGVSFLRERTQGTLERLLATPLRRFEIVVGYMGGFGVFIIIQSIIIVLYSVYVLRMYMAGSIISVLCITFLLAIAAQSLGTLLSAYAKNEFQMIQFVPIVIVPQVFFSGIFHTEQVGWINAIGKIMPLTYGGDALKEIMLRGQGLHSVLTDILVLLGFSLVFILLNVVALKKHRKL